MVQDLYFEIDTLTIDKMENEEYRSTLSHKFETECDAISFILYELKAEHSPEIGFFKKMKKKAVSRFYTLVRVEKCYI